MAEGIIHSVLSGLTNRVEHRGEIIVIGLGRFGASLATTLTTMDLEVLGVDADPERVQELADVLTQVVEADATSERALRQLGAQDAVTVAVCIGDVEASVLACAALADLGVPNVWAKAISAAHGKILQRVGAHHVVFPEADMGSRVAHLVTGQIVDFVALDDDFVLAELFAPGELVGVALGESDLRAKYHVTVVCVKPHGGQFTYADRDTVLESTDLIVIAGHRSHVSRFTKTN
ncbi:MAG TPA: TrkA family potassium uptake protein [Ilumatobacter sp.]|nr:TrkA family potassium uptake protein [Ilumatobacter sp.]